MSQMPDPYSRPDKASRSEYVPFHALEDSHFGSESHVAFLRNLFERQACFLDLALTKANFYLATLDEEADAFEIQFRQGNIDQIEQIAPLINEIREILA